MTFLNSLFCENRDFLSLQKAVTGKLNTVLCTGLSGVQKSLLVSALKSKTDKKIVLVTADEREGEFLCEDLSSLGNKTVLYPFVDRNVVSSVTASKEYETKRVDTLSKVFDGDFGVLISSVDALIQYTIPKKVFALSALSLSVGKEISQKEIVEFCERNGYERCDTVISPSQYSVRGGIVDLFSAGNDNPCRIEFWGDEIDTISYFDTDSQRRTETVEELKILPSSDICISNEELINRIENYYKTTPHLTEKQKENIENDLEKLKSGITIPADRYLTIIYDEKATLFDYLDDVIFVLCESANIEKRLENYRFQEREDIKKYLEEGFVSEKCLDFSITDTEFYNSLKTTVIVDSFSRGQYKKEINQVVSFNIRSSSAWNGDLTVLKEDLDYYKDSKYTVIIFAGNEKAGKTLALNLTTDGYSSVFSDASVQKNQINVMPYSLSSGFEIPDVKLCLITARKLNPQKKRRYKYADKGKAFSSLDELKKGDSVVHASYGIGIFDGIEHIKTGTVIKDYIKIRYYGQDVLYVPVTQLDLVSKYIGASENSLKLNKLGSGEWQRTRSRVKKTVADMADKLTELYKKRMSAVGYAFSPDTDLQSDFESRFPYEETEDQKKCIDEIKRDMERAVPMDRLLCGDVGFGKTEVALRAAFKCISEGKQCALLVPTTILAWQHYNTASTRIGELPVNLKLLSRFVSKKEQKKTVEGLKQGRVDMVIGTHRLISADVSFRDLGLVIIDEEQRFGVAQKEKLKELYPNVDILTLSATPIPRTLNMALSGLRDMSTIDEAPSDRHPVQTYILEHNNSFLIDVIKKELRRSGQVYYLHNRVETIERTALKLREMLPDARIGVAHGKMNEEELSDIWKKMIEREIDVLVCTTIIETGIDVPNVNTLIIEDADRMGLSQLHQLRGRVGRSSRRAYAYLTFKKGKVINEDAEKRLNAIREFTEFGSGYKIAMRDLEIRGAGSILGGEQHGYMEAVGYDMYLSLLNDAVNEKNGIPTKDDNPCTVDLNVSAHIPENYIPSLSSRLDMYKRIAAVENDDDVSDVLDELCDRFGEPPTAVLGLINIALLRSKANSNDIYEIVKEGKDVVLRLNSFKSETFVKLSEKLGDRVRLCGTDKPYFAVSLNKNRTLEQLVDEIVKAL